MVLASLEENKRMSVAIPQREGISAIRLDEDQLDAAYQPDRFASKRQPSGRQ